MAERFRSTASTTTYRPMAIPQVNQEKQTQQKKRSGDRKQHELRRIFMKTGVISQATGSAYLEQDNTKVIVGIYGPRAAKHMDFSDKGRLVCELKFCPNSVRGERKKYQQDKEERELSMLMTQALELSVILEKFPKSVLDIYVLVLESDGSVLSAAITAASLAISSAGIECYDLVAACSVSVQKSGNLYLDPTEEEENEDTSDANVMLSYMASLNEITQIFHFGDIQRKQIEESIELSLDGCNKMHEMMRATLLNKSN